VNATKKNIFLPLAVTGLAAIGASLWIGRFFSVDPVHHAQPSTPQPVVDMPPDHGRVEGEFVFTSQNNTPFTTSSMAGSTWLVSFFFTSCDGPCPFLNGQIAGYLTKFPDLQALSITTDPDTDTPDVLARYAQTFNIPGDRWTFAQTSKDQMIKYGQTVLKLPVGEEPDAHSPRIVLLDSSGHIRGWYDSQDSGDLKSLTVALEQLSR
jgi:protein SCO1/2